MEPQAGLPHQNSVDNYDQMVAAFAYYTEMPAEDRLAYLQKRLNEEVDELLGSRRQISTHRRQILWGVVTDPTEQKQMAGEIGDCLYYITAAASEKGIPFHDLVCVTAARFGGHATTTHELDALMQHRMEPSIRPNYKPDYMAMQMFGIEPTRHPKQVVRLVTEDYDDAVGKDITITPDGYYGLWYALTYVSNFMSLNAESYQRAASNALGILSAVSQRRLGVPLVTIIEANVSKLTRRAAAGTLKQGDDTERDRPRESDRPNYSAWSNTVALLIDQTEA